MLAAKSFLVLGALDFFVYEVNYDRQHNQNQEFHGNETLLIVLKLTHFSCIMPNVSR